MTARGPGFVERVDPFAGHEASDPPIRASARAAGGGLAGRMPWYAKLAAKLVLSRVPVNYSVWRRLNLFRHGAMDDPAYAVSVVEHHLRAGGQLPRPFTALELGPGDSLLSAIVAYAFGAERTFLVDVGDMVVRDLHPYERCIARLRERGLRVPAWEAAQGLSALLRSCSATYMTGGHRSLQSLPTASVDVEWSQAVLEHVRRAEFAATIGELRRVLRPGGFSSHTVDLRDHLSGGLNHLRFPEAVWESRLMASSGFYVNRIRLAEMLSLFEEARFQPEVTRLRRWDDPPIRRERMAKGFRDLPAEDLLVLGFDVLLRPLAVPQRQLPSGTAPAPTETAP